MVGEEGRINAAAQVIANPTSSRSSAAPAPLPLVLYPIAIPSRVSGLLLHC